MKHAVTALFVLAGITWGQEPRALSLKSRIPLPNVNGRIDHFSADLKGQRIQRQRAKSGGNVLRRARSYIVA